MLGMVVEVIRPVGGAIELVAILASVGYGFLAWDIWPAVLVGGSIFVWESVKFLIRAKGNINQPGGFL